MAKRWEAAKVFWPEKCIEGLQALTLPPGEWMAARAVPWNVSKLAWGELLLDPPDAGGDWRRLGEAEMWVMRWPRSCAGRSPYCVVMRNVPPEDFVLACHVEEVRGRLMAKFTKMSGETLGEHTFEEPPVTVRDVLLVASQTATESGCLQSVNQNVRLLFPDRCKVADDSEGDEVWSAQPKRRKVTTR
ncbi:unnamed protein product [Symbiodinium natans]|uniref:Uncharacterized protein n=1 Tax=Symbiodinium natans TaxID=878477 RepID=A0A812L0J1_9DINO|nr:unnamed protein product [Symbiodinium natans]